MKNNTCPTKEDESALKSFLTNIRCLDELDEFTGSVNVFDVLGMSRCEIRHSNILAWLLDPKGSHGMGELFLRMFFQYLCEETGVDVFELLVGGWDTYKVLREYKHIDLVIVSKERKIVVAIEHKVDSVEHDNQLSRYEETVKCDYQGYKQYFLFLSPDGREPSESNWRVMGYDKVLEVLRYCNEHANVDDVVKMLLSQYENLLRREFMIDQKLKDVCNQIYREHKRALDLIFEYKDDRILIHHGMIVAWLKEHNDVLKLDEQHSSKGYIRFSTSALESCVPLLGKGKTSNWNSNHSAYYELVNQKDALSLKLTLSSRNLPDQVLRKVEEKFRKVKFDNGWEWKVLENWRALWHAPKDDNGESLDKTDVEGIMKEVLDTIKKFENQKFA